MSIKNVLVVLGIAFLGGVVALGVNGMFSDDVPTQGFAQHENAKFTLAEKLTDVPSVNFVSVAEVATPAVVHIKTTMKTRSSNGPSNPLEDFFGPGFRQPNAGPQQATGSGVIIKKTDTS